MNPYEELVSADKMPPCPLCGRPLKVPPAKPAEQLMVFVAHGLASLAHSGCEPRSDGEMVNRAVRVSGRVRTQSPAR